jgi:hypothetical protein
MPRVGFEPTIPVFERAKTVRALDRAGTVIGYLRLGYVCMYKGWAIKVALAPRPLIIYRASPLTAAMIITVAARRLG